MSARLLTSLILCLLVAKAAASPPMLRTVCGAVADAEEVVGNKTLAVGKAVGSMVLKPIAIVGGLKAAAVGAGIKAGGAGIKFVGAKMVKDGAIMEATGAGVKGAGLGVAAMGLKPAAEKIVAAGQMAEKSLDQTSQMAHGLAKSVGDTSIQIDARIDSPLIGHHRKNVNMTAGLGTAADQMNEIKGGHETQQVEQQVEQEAVKQQEVVKQQLDTKPRSKRASSTHLEPEVVRSAMALVKDAKMEGCVQRAVCDLNCNPQGFGNDGKQVFMTMVRLQGTKLLEESESKQFQEAAQKGRSLSGKCEQCSENYKCNSKSADLIKLASHINA